MIPRKNRSYSYVMRRLRNVAIGSDRISIDPSRAHERTRMESWQIISDWSDWSLIESFRVHLRERRGRQWVLRRSSRSQKLIMSIRFIMKKHQWIEMLWRSISVSSEKIREMERHSWSSVIIMICLTLLSISVVNLFHRWKNEPSSSSLFQTESTGKISSPVCSNSSIISRLTFSGSKSWYNFLSFSVRESLPCSSFRRDTPSEYDKKRQ